MIRFACHLREGVYGNSERLRLMSLRKYLSPSKTNKLEYPKQQLINKFRKPSGDNVQYKPAFGLKKTNLLFFDFISNIECPRKTDVGIHKKDIGK